MYIKKKNKLLIPSCLEEVLKKLTKIGALPILVGGCVRDHLLNLSIKDYDIEVFNIDSFETLENELKSFGKVQLVGKSFGVLKLNIENYEFDFALPRCEEKVALGYKGFEVIINTNLSFKEAAIRRDFTINAIGYDYFKDEYLDPFNGLISLKNAELKHIDDTSFIEDPLRVYRAIQFAARFGFHLHESTFTLCKKMVEENRCVELSKERIYVEFEKLFLRSLKPSIGMKLLKELGILKYYKMLEALVGCEQEKEYHPEGDVWVHTLYCLDELVKIKTNDSKKDMILFFAVLCHDLGKPLCTKVINSKITSYKHEVLGVEPTIEFLKLLTNDKKMIEEVSLLVRYHLSIFQLYLHDSSLKAVKRLSTKVNIDDLCKVSLADCLGRDIPNKNKCYKAVSFIQEKAKELNINNQALKALVLGRDLIKLGFNPGHLFKEILDFSYELQIEEDLRKEELIICILKKFNN